MEIVFMQKDWEIRPSELNNKGLVGEIMLDIIFYDPNCCRDKESYLELVEETAKDIIQKVVEKRGRN